MQIKSLEYLMALERHGSINKAAAASYISQQGMSRVMDSMERELGVTLFNRSHNGITLTDKGMSLCRCAKEIVPLFNQTTEELRLDMEQRDVPILMSDCFVQGVLRETYERLCNKGRYSFSQVSNDRRLSCLQERDFKGILLDAWFDGDPEGEEIISSPSFATEQLLKSRIGIMTAACSGLSSYTIEQMQCMKLLSVNTPVYRSCVQSVFGEADMRNEIVFIENAHLVQNSISEDPNLAILTTKLSFYLNVPSKRRASLAFSPIEPPGYFTAYAVHRADHDSSDIEDALSDWRQAVRLTLQQTESGQQVSEGADETSPA